MTIHWHRAALKEVNGFTEEIREDLADALARLDEGLILSLPLSRPMPSIGPKVHELRLKDRSGAYRVIYFIVKGQEVWILHGFKKTTEQTPDHVIKLCKKRMKGVL